MGTPDVSAATALPAPFRRVAIHRVRWTGPDPIVGDYLLAPGGRSAYRIESVDVLPRNSMLQAPRLRLTCWSCSAQAVPENATVHLWTCTERVAPSAEQRADLMRRIRLRKAQDAHEALARARAVGSDDGHVAAVRQTAGAAGQVIRDSWDDPDDTNTRSTRPWQVHGHRARDGLRELRDRGGLTLSHYEAADRMRRDIEEAAGSHAPSDDVRVDICSQRMFEPSQRRLDAAKRVRQAWAAIGLIASPLIVWIICQGRRIEDFEAEHPTTPGRHRDVLLAALDRLADAYADKPAAKPPHQTTQPPALAEAAAPAASTEPAKPLRGRARIEAGDGEPFQPWQAPIITRGKLAASVAQLLAEAPDPDEPLAG